ncbi:MAG: phosphoribosyltransferase family protein, partial [Vulcanisaeta sp.]
MGVAGMIGIISFHDGWNVGELLKYAIPVLKHRGGGDTWAAVFRRSSGLTTLLMREDDKAPSGEAGLLCIGTNNEFRGVVKCGTIDVAYCLDGVVVRPMDVCRLINGEVKALPYTSLIALT